MDIEDYVADLRERQNRTRPEWACREVHYPLGEITLPRHIDHWASVAPNRSAIVFRECTVTYSDLAKFHQALATWLLNQGVSAGDRVAVHLPNVPEFIIAFAAILRIGAVHVPVNPMFRAGEASHELTDADPMLIVTSREVMAVLDDASENVRTIPRLIVEDDAWKNALATEPYTGCADDLDALAALNYTGGTTGLPKGCCHTQKHMLYTAASTACANNLELDGQYVALCYLPIFWIAGEDLGIVLPIVLGGTVILMKRWNAVEALDAIERHRVTIMGGPVESYIELMALPGIGERDLSSLTNPQTSSFVQKLTPEVRRMWQKVAPGSMLRESSYGMTETHTLDTSTYGFTAEDHDLRSEPIFCGLPVPETDIAVVSFETGEPLPIGDVGEIIVRSPSVTTGYWRNMEATKKQLRQGWIHTGDYGRIDASGCLHYLGRAKEMIKTKGMSVFPAEIETILSQHPQVDSVAVVPEEDMERGQRPVAFVIGKESENMLEMKLHEWASENMASYKVPCIRIVDSFPMTETGKVKKNALNESYHANHK